MPRTGELILIGISISMFITLIISQTIWTRGQDEHGPLQQHDQVVLGYADGLIPAGQLIFP